MSEYLSGGQLAGGNSTSKREENDFYATNPETLKLFLYEFWKDNSFEGDILEPACGQGHISETLKEMLPNFNITSTDLIDRGYGEGGVNFLEFIGFKLTFQSSKICYQKYIVINKSQYRITISPKTYNECDISIWNITKNSPFEHTEKIIFEDGKSRVIPICNKIMQGFEDLEEDLTELKLKYK